MGEDGKAILRDKAVATRQHLLTQTDRDFDTLFATMGDIALAKLPDIKGKIVAGYWPLPMEIDPRPLMSSLEDAGAQIALPVIVNKDAPLQWRLWQGEEFMTSGPHNIFEPDARCPVVTPEIVLVPLVAFDKRGHRLGFGGGYYDRSLEVLRQSDATLHAIGISLDAMELDEIPNDPFDQPLDSLVTESGWRDFS